MSISLLWKRAAGTAALLVLCAAPRPGPAADELGNIEAPAVPGVEAPVPPSVSQPRVAAPRVPETAAPDTVPVPVPPVRPGTPGVQEPGDVTILPFNTPLPASNATLPAANGTFPLYNATLPVTNGTLPGRVFLPLNNATRPSDNATRPARNGTEPAAVPAGPLTPADFLPRTSEQPEKPVDQPQPQKPVKPAEQKTPPGKPVPEKPERKEPAKGDPMQIPEEARKTGSLEFLKGCWVGRRPEYNSKRMITERFCFDEKGVGKRTISDPGHAGQCVGAARAVMNQGGVLRIVSERSYCTSGDEWGRADMTCRGEGSNTPCTWMFKDIGSSARQAYTITFVRD